MDVSTKFLSSKANAQNSNISSAHHMSTKERSKSFKDDMMSLLIASVKNVNPMQQSDVSSSMNMASMLIAVEQGQAQVDAMERLEGVIKDANQNIASYLPLLDSEVLIEGDRVLLSNGVAHFNFQIKDDAEQPVLEVVDSLGEVVFSEFLKPMSTQFAWRGVQGQSDEFYRNLRYRIVEGDDDQKRNVSKRLAYYTSVSEIIENEGVKRIKTSQGDQILTSQIFAVRRRPASELSSDVFAGLGAMLERKISEDQIDVLG